MFYFIKLNFCCCYCRCCLRIFLNLKPISERFSVLLLLLTTYLIMTVFILLFLIYFFNLFIANVKSAFFLISFFNKAYMRFPTVRITKQNPHAKQRFSAKKRPKNICFLFRHNSHTFHWTFD